MEDDNETQTILSVGASSVGRASVRSNHKKKKASFKPGAETIRSPVKDKDHLHFLHMINQQRTEDPLGITYGEENATKTNEYTNIHAVDFETLNIDFDDFYHEKVQSFSNERQYFDHYMEIVEPKKDENHQLIWFNRNIIDELQQSEIEQKELLNKIDIIRQEIDSLEKEIFYEKEQKKVRLERIHSLESLGRPVEEDVTYIIPEKFSKAAVTVHGIMKRNKEEDAKKKAIATTAASASSPKNSSGNKTEAKGSFMKLAKTGEILVLEKQLHSETMKIYALFQEISHKIEQLVSSKHALEEQFTQVSQREYQASYACYEKVKENEAQCFHLIEELLSLKYRIWIAQREEMEELEQLAQDRAYFQHKQNELKDQLLNEMNHTKKVFKAELDDCTKEFERQLTELNLQLKTLSHQQAVLQNTQKQSSQKHERLVALLASHQQRYQRMQRSYRLEMEGYHTEVRFLQQKLQKLQHLSSERRKAQKKEQKRRQRVSSQPKKGLYASMAEELAEKDQYEQDSLDEEEDEAETSNTLSTKSSSSSSELSRDREIRDRDEAEEGDLMLRESQRVTVSRQRHPPGRVSTPATSTSLYKSDSQRVGSLNILPSSSKKKVSKKKSKSKNLKLH